MKYILLLLTLCFAIACGEQSNTGLSSQKEQALTEENQSKLLKIQPPVRLSWSLERSNINKRAELWNDKNKVSYIYLVDFGKVMAFYTIKGKVSSVNSQITNPEQIVCNETFEAGNYSVISSPAEDGSYGTNGNAVFFFTTDGTYVEWSRGYMLVDKPLKMATPPMLVREIK